MRMAVAACKADRSPAAIPPLPPGHPFAALTLPDSSSCTGSLMVSHFPHPDLPPAEGGPGWRDEIPSAGSLYLERNPPDACLWRPTFLGSLTRSKPSPITSCCCAAHAIAATASRLCSAPVSPSGHLAYPVKLRHDRCGHPAAGAPCQGYQPALSLPESPLWLHECRAILERLLLLFATRAPGLGQSQ